MKKHPFIRFCFGSLIIFCAIFNVSCDRGISTEEDIFRSSVKRLSQLIIEYENIPDETKLNGTKAIISKNKEEVKSFYEKTISEWQKIDNNLLELKNSKLDDKWKLDTIFCRAVLYTKLVVMNSQNETVSKTINILNDYVSNFSNKEINSWTKAALKKAVLNNYGKVFTVQLSDEENIAIIFRMLIAFQYMRLKEYDRALQTYEALLTQYPQGFLADSVKVQIDTCRELREEDRT